MRPRDDVYVQIVPDPRPVLGAPRALVRVLLPYGPKTEAADVRTTWGQVSDRLQYALRHARSNEASVLPAGLEDCLAVELTIPMPYVMDLSVDLYRLLEADIQRMIIAAVNARDADRRN
jgi:hypothetical protein